MRVIRITISCDFHRIFKALFSVRVIALSIVTTHTQGVGKEPPVVNANEYGCENFWEISKLGIGPLDKSWQNDFQTWTRQAMEAVTGQP
jgi:hypothetical protein